MPLNPSDPLVQDAVFGKQVEDWLNGDIGSFVINRARSQSEEATEQLKKANPFQPEGIVAIQMKIRVADLIIQWLGEAVAMGMQAKQTLEEER